MRYFKGLSAFSFLPAIMVSILSISLSGCDSDDDDDSGTGYFQLYNTSENAPAIYLTLIEDEDEDEERTLSGVSYGESTSYYEYDTATYSYDLAWQEDEDSLEVFYEGELTVSADNIQLLVLAEDITNPSVYSYTIPVDDPDADDEVFNIRFLNMHSYSGGIDVYLSDSDETFNEASLIGSYAYTEMADSSEYELDNYVFYITASGSTDILYQSSAISFAYTSQYIFVVRANDGAGSSPFALDKLTSASGATSYPDEEAEAEYRIYNGLRENDLFPSYQGSFDLYINGIDDTPEVSSINTGEFSAASTIDFGDYSMDITLPASNEILSQNHLLTLGANTDKTAFFYLFEEITEDDDGNEESEVYVNALVVENSNRHSYYDHSVNIINLVDDFAVADFYFVRSNETIDSAAYNTQIRYITPQAIALLNNTYTVYAVATENNNERILASQIITLDETRGDLFLLLEENTDEATGYSITFSEQKD